MHTSISYWMAPQAYLFSQGRIPGSSSLYPVFSAKTTEQHESYPPPKQYYNTHLWHLWDTAILRDSSERGTIDLQQPCSGPDLDSLVAVCSEVISEKAAQSRTNENSGRGKYWLEISSNCESNLTEPNDCTVHAFIEAVTYVTD